jgi:glycerol-3-phosphate O-acyltransferase
MYRVGATFDEIFAQNVAFLERVGAVARDGEALRPGPEAQTLAFLAEFTRCYLEAYRLAAETALACLGPGAPRGAAADRRGLVKEALERGRAAFLSGHLAMREAISQATLSNAFQWLEDQGLVVRGEGGKLRLGAEGEAGVRAVLDGIATHLAS